MKYSFLKSFNSIFDKYGLKLNLFRGDYVLDLNCVKNLNLVLFFIRDHENALFKLLVDIFSIDFPECEKRFTLVYSLLSLKYNARMFIKLSLHELSSVPSITNVYKSACWMEREVWDMNGIFFVNHPDLRRLLTDYGFNGHPLKKDFPLSGYTEVRYDDSQKRVISEPIEMAQEYRTFHFKSFWE